MSETPNDHSEPSDHSGGHTAYPSFTLAGSAGSAGSEVVIPPLGVGTWAWGDTSTWGMGGYDAALTEETIAEAFDASVAAGATFFDTAEVYGKGESERIIGRLAEDPGHGPTWCWPPSSCRRRGS